jgi:RNA polymerase sigma factor (sigma-70 family)
MSRMNVSASRAHANSIASAAQLPDFEDYSATPQLERNVLIQEALSHLSEREKLIVSYYLEDQSPQEIAERLKLTVSSVTKIRQRAIIKLRQRLDIMRKGERDEEKRSGK